MDSSKILQMRTPPAILSSPPLLRVQNYKMLKKEDIERLKQDLQREQAHSARLSNANQAAFAHIEKLTKEKTQFARTVGELENRLEELTKEHMRILNLYDEQVAINKMLLEQAQEVKEEVDEESVSQEDIDRERKEREAEMQRETRIVDALMSIIPPTSPAPV